MFIDGLDGNVEGDMSIPVSSGGNTFGGKEFNTLDEPISETVVRNICLTFNLI
jgi:hypothetical protein